MAENGVSSGGYSVFHETMADMTFPEVEQAARAGAVALWGLGVIEQHGPHLPLATDVYVPAAILRQARHMLARQGVESVIVPPFYWGVNHVTGRFTGSIEVRPSVMVELMSDVFVSLKKDGFAKVFCLSGHGDALHNRTLLDGTRMGSAAAPIEGRMVLTPAAAARLGFASDDPHLALAEAASAAPGKYVDVHAGDCETSLMWASFPEVVRSALLPELAPTNFVQADLEEWRKGQEHTLRKTPLGYLGDPAAANAERGATLLQQQAAQVTAAILAALDKKPRG